MATIDLGKIKMVNRGTWDSATAYVVDDIVQYTDGGTLSTFVAVANSTNQAPASGGTENSSFWKFMAKGTDQIAIAYSAVQTADFTVASSTAYFVDTSGGAITVTLPSSPSDGSFFKIIDYAKTFQTNPVTLAANGSYIEGNTDDFILRGRGTIIEMAYNGTGGQGWVFNSYNTEDMGSKYHGNTAASGGDQFTPIHQGVGSKRWMDATSDAEEVYMDGNDIVHKFLTSGTFTVHSVGSDSLYGDKVEYLIIGGGGGGGAHHGAGGGAGGYRANTAYNQAVTAQAYTITVGAGGSHQTGNSHGNNGSASNAFGLTSDGGGGGGGHPAGGGRSGGSGGGANHSGSHGNATGNGTGHRGGPNSQHQGGGGGGAGEPGADHYGSHQGGHGGRGVENDITGRNRWYAGGGSATGHNHTSTPAGGLGGGGTAGGGYGVDGTGSGGGGTDGSSGGHRRGGQGGDGIVVIRYRARE